MVNLEFPLKYFSLRSNLNKTLLERRIAKLYGEDYNTRALDTLKEFNPKSYRNLTRLVGFAIRKKRREQNRKYISNLIDFLK
jgi:hypothetical protein